MGVVLAAYDPELDRKVAIKLLAYEAAPTSKSQLRLQREAQALAKLSHPNVVAVYDVGIHEGKVFVAMELVEGQTLRQWMGRKEHRERSWREVVPVFVAAGRGLAAAHNQGVVHRDFKPANVMLDLHGRVRVMDFGLARAWAEDDEPDDMPRAAGGAAISLTATGSIMGTPAYMSPEQYEDAHVGPASDQFSYCVTLYEALCGARPFKGRDSGSLAVAITSGEVQPMPRAVPGWLQAVVLRGLSPRIEQRFPSMDALLEALETGGIRRRRGLAVAATGLLTALVGGVVGVAAWQDASVQAQCVAEGAAVDELWNTEAQSRVKAAFAASGLDRHEEARSRLWPWIDRAVASWRDTRSDVCRGHRETGELDAIMYARASWCLDDRKERLASTLRSFEELDAAGVGRTLPAILGQTPPEGCTDPTVLRNLPDPPPPSKRESVVALRHELAELSALYAQGKVKPHVDRARALARDAEALGWPPLVAASQKTLGQFLVRAGKVDEGAVEYESAYRNAALSGDWDHAAAAATELIYVLAVRLDRIPEARSWAGHAQVAISQAGDPLGLREARRLESLGLIERAAGQHAAAVKMTQRALGIYQGVYGPDHPRLATALENLGAAHIQLGRFDEALETLDRVVALRSEHLGPHHPKVGTAMGNAAAALIKAERYDEAIERMKVALANAREVYGDNDPHVATIHVNMGLALCNSGLKEEGIRSYEAALAVFEATEGKDSPRLGAVLENLAVEVDSTGDRERARALRTRALDIYTKVLGPGHPQLGRIRTVMAEAEVEAGEHEAAVRHAEAALQAFANADSPDINEPFARLALAKSLAALGRDPGRVRELATHARAGLAKEEGAGSYVAEADALLSKPAG